ncbi:hypothetical protein [Pedobacter faecalis]|uniref:hypothetical protein n=1 Tax=Pedobacter faecalis TaxID=3041495 RepID=UPI00254B6DD9|nr:hypothetical protein [Pedobacter sp. ELA7]
MKAQQLKSNTTEVLDKAGVPLLTVHKGTGQVNVPVKKLIKRKRPDYLLRLL